MTWFKWGCGARLSRPKCFLFLFLFYVLFFRILCVCTPDSQSRVKENKLNIFKMDKKKKNVLFNVKNTVLMMLNFLNAPTLNVKNKKCAWSVIEKPLYCTLCWQSTKCNQSRSSQSSQAFRADLGRYPDVSTPIQRCSTSDWIVFGPCSSNESVHLYFNLVQTQAERTAKLHFVGVRNDGWLVPFSSW